MIMPAGTKGIQIEAELHGSVQFFIGMVGLTWILGND